MVRPVGMHRWLALLALSAALLGSGCGSTQTECPFNRQCDTCTMSGECAWCFETGTCQAPQTFCSGEIAYRPEQCEEGHADEDPSGGGLDAAVGLATSAQ